MSDGPVQALCCQCGNLAELKSTRLSSQPGLHRMEQLGPYPVPAPDDTEGWARCVITRKCKVCDEYTTHAFLRDDVQHRDILEQSHWWRCIEGRTRDPRNPEWSVRYCGFCVAGVVEYVADRMVS